MPAGSLTDGGRSYAVKVGEAFSSVEELSGLELMKLEAADKGVVKLSDVADIEMADNAEEMYAKINGNDGILLSLQKQSNASTAAVSHALQKAMDKLKMCIRDRLRHCFPGIRLVGAGDRDGGLYCGKRIFHAAFPPDAFQKCADEGEIFLPVH